MPDSLPPALVLPSRWTVTAPSEAAFDALLDGSLLEWWSDVYLAAREVDPGEPSGLGRTVDLLTKGWLPYRMRWRAETTAVARPERIVIRGTGDLVGEGVWTLTHEDGTTTLRYRWAVSVGAPWMRATLPVLRPVFAWNHRWAMARGEAGLRAHLARSATALDPPKA